MDIEVLLPSGMERTPDMHLLRRTVHDKPHLTALRPDTLAPDKVLAEPIRPISCTPHLSHSFQTLGLHSVLNMQGDSPQGL